MEMKVTNYMIYKWSKAAMLIIFGVVFLIYMDSVNAGIRSIFSSIPNAPNMGAFFDLSFAIYFIIAIWCFVDAGLNLLTSFREQKTTMDDLAAKLDVIERKLSSSRPQQPVAQPYSSKPIVVEQAGVSTEPTEVYAPAPPTDVPPPP